eukprot:scaffold100878_cov81-Phaeocystis_antarctica.AAC.3
MGSTPSPSHPAAIAALRERRREQRAAVGLGNHGVDGRLDRAHDADQHGACEAARAVHGHPELGLTPLTLFFLGLAERGRVSGEGFPD